MKTPVFSHGTFFISGKKGWGPKNSASEINGYMEIELTHRTWETILVNFEKREKCKWRKDQPCSFDIRVVWGQKKG